MADLGRPILFGLELAVGGNITSVASSGLFTSATAHGFSAGQAVRFITLTGGADLSVELAYYVRSANLSSTTFELAATIGGALTPHSSNVTAATIARVSSLNHVVKTTLGLVGCTVDTFDYSDLDVRQFTEPRALAQGIDVGGVWLGARRAVMTGTVYDTSRGLTYDRLAALEADMMPNARFLLDETTFGFSDLTFYKPNAAGVAFFAISVRPNGLRVVFKRKDLGGRDTAPLAIPWSVSFLCHNPAAVESVPEEIPEGVG